MQNLHYPMPRFGRRAALLVLACAAPLLALGSEGSSTVQAPVRVLAAANLKFALQAMAEAYQKHSGQRVQISYGATAALAQQVRQGLAADLFMAADAVHVQALYREGLTRDAGAPYARGQLALLVARKDAPRLLPAPGAVLRLPDLQQLARQLQPHEKLALAQPRLAPYGAAAEQVLQTAGVWPQLHKQLVLGDNVAQATQFVVTGAAPVGLTAAAMMHSPEVAARTVSVLVPMAWHAPIDQHMALLKGARREAQGFYAWLLSPSAQSLWQHYGYALASVPTSASASVPLRRQ